MRLNIAIVATAIILMFLIILFGLTDIDVYIQNYFYDSTAHKWILNSNLQPYKFIFYDGAKKFLILIAVGFLVVLLFFRSKKVIKEHTKGIIIVILSAIIVPITVGMLKKSTNMPCPKNEILYGGKMPRTAVWQSYKEPYSKMEKISCWPAGHASGGFALMSLFFLFKSRRRKWIALATGVTVGWIMGIYKMLIGDHFFSHTVITMVLAWLLILIIAKIVECIPQRT